MGKISVAIVEDNKELCDCLVEYFAREGAFAVKGLAHDGVSALEMLKETDFEILLLDIVLPNKDGIYVLEEIKKVKNDFITIVISSLIHSYAQDMAVSLGTDYLVIKPFDIKLLSKRMLDLHKLKQKKILGGSHTPKASITSSAEPGIQQANTSNAEDVFIEELLDNAGIARKLKGYSYLKTAFKLCVSDETMLDSITKVLYSEIAKLHKTTAVNVEKSIRHSIQLSYERGGAIRNYENSFGKYLKSGRVTNGDLIYSATQQYKERRV